MTESSDTRDQHDQQQRPYPDWQTIKSKVMPYMLGPQGEPDARDWSDIIDEDPDEPKG